MRIEVSATGKVLIAGGYIVLEKEFKGIVLPLTAKFHATIENKTNFEYNSTENNNEKLIFIETPQIEFKKYIYSYKRNSVSTELILIKNDRTEKNKFIDSALNFSFKLLNELIRQQKILNFDEMLNHIKITLFGDQEFYTKTKGKTGLGSSAALTASLVSAFILFFVKIAKIKIDGKKLKRFCCLVAIFAHSKAQGKIGSGFDIVSCFYGALFYQKLNENFTENLSSFDLKLLINKNPIENSKKFRFPKNLDIIMGQTEEGSKTTEMVEKVLEWRKNEKNDLFWGKIFDCVKIIFQNFQKNPNFGNTTNEIKSAFLKMRSLYKKMGILSGVEIEPDSQTKLLDETGKIEGVIGSCVPGAGGYDAIVAIILNDVITRKNVEKLWISNNIKILKVGIEKSEGISFDDIC